MFSLVTRTHVASSQRLASSGTIQRLRCGLASLVFVASACSGGEQPATQPTAPNREAREAAGHAVSALTDASECSEHQWSLLTTGLTTACARGGVDTKCWGVWSYWNPDGSLGAFELYPSGTAPLVLGDQAEVTTAATGWFHTCAAAANGVWCWGDNSSGQLGDGTLVSRQSPARVARDFGDQVVSLASKAATTCALTKSGDVWCWGNNAGSIAGAEGVLYQLSPNQVDLGGRSARQVAVGGDFACAVTTENEIVCWGSNNYHALGVAGLPQTARAVPIDTGGKGARFVAVALESACAVFDDDTTACWGHNDYGELATGDQQPRSTPTFVSLASPSGYAPIEIDGGSRHFCGRYIDGSLRCWGKNTCWELSGVNQANLPGGQLGLGLPDSSMQMTPQLVALGDASATGIKLGYDNSCASFADGTIKCWGCNYASMQQGEFQGPVDTTPDLLVNNAPARLNPLPLGEAGACFTAPELDADTSCADVSISGTKRYNPDRWNEGTADFSYPRSVVVPSAIGVDEGNAGTGSVTVTLHGPESLVTCTYAGGSSVEHPQAGPDVAAGKHYFWQSCTLGAQAGDVLDVLSIQVHVDNGDSASVATRTRVSALFASPRPCTGGTASADLREILTQVNAADATAFKSALDTADVDADAIMHKAGSTEAAASAHAALERSREAAFTWADQLMAFAFRRSRASSTPEEVVAAALSTFAAETRWALGQYKTPKKFNRACPDFVSDHLLLDLIDGVLDNDRASYAAALARIEASLQCSPLERELDINEALTLGYDATLARFAEDVRPIARRGLMSALLNLFLMVHDDTKAVGPTPLYRWLSDNRVPLGAIFAEPNSVPRLSGLWLRSPAGDQLVQIQKLCEASMSAVNCVSGGHLLDALIDPIRLGVGGCTALEMVSTPFDSARGYVCDRGLCASEAGQLVPGSGTPMLNRLFANGGLTQFGVDLAALQSDRCRGPAARTDGGGTGSAPDIYACASSGLMSLSGRAKEECALDTIAAPRTMGFTDVRRSWGNDPCTAANEAGDDPDDPPDHKTPPVDETEEEREVVNAVDNKINDPNYRAAATADLQGRGYNVTDAVYALAVAFFEQLGFANWADLNWQAGTTDFDSGSVDIKIARGQAPGDLADTLEHEFLHALMELAVWNDPNLSFEQKKDQLENDNGREHHIICHDFKLGQGCHQNCPEGSSCGACSAAGGLISDLLSCGFTQGQLSPIPRGGGVIDPSPISDSHAPSWRSCFDNGMLPTIPTACLALDCADGALPTLDGERCVCSSGGGVFMPPIISCGAVHCSAGAIATPTPSGCVCLPFGQDPLLPPGLPPMGCALCTRVPDPTLARCVSQPQMCFFQDEPRL